MVEQKDTGEVTPVRRKRDKNATRQAILGAVETILLRDGGDGLGVNAAAREAGVDKVLIYRYFGGMAGLLESFAEYAGIWPSFEDLAGGDVDALKRKSPAERLTALAVNYLREMRSRPVAREVLAGETSQADMWSGVLEMRRQALEQGLWEVLVSEAGPGPDIVSLWTVLESSVNYLAIRSRRSEPFNGLDLSDEKDWTRLEAALRTMINSVYAGWR